MSLNKSKTREQALSSTESCFVTLKPKILSGPCAYKSMQNLHWRGWYRKDKQITSTENVRIGVLSTWPCSMCGLLTALFIIQLYVTRKSYIFTVKKFEHYILLYMASRPKYMLKVLRCCSLFIVHSNGKC